MTKREQAYTTKFIKAIKDGHISFPAGPIEVKMARGKRVYRKQFATHQIHALHIAATGTLAWKIPDAGFANPFDIMLYEKAPTWVLAVFEESRYYLVDAVHFFAMCEISCDEKECASMALMEGEL